MESISEPSNQMSFVSLILFKNIKYFTKMGILPVGADKTVLPLQVHFV